MKQDLSRAMYENAIGRLAVSYLESLRAEELPPLAESNALELIAEIKAILDNDALEDPECFQRIDAIVDLYNDNHMYTPRHDF